MNNIFLDNTDKIFFIPGINISKINNELHCKESLYELNSTYDYNKKMNNIYNKIAKKFVNYEAWEVNNLCCWNCTLNFSNKPVFIPLTIQKTYIEVLGNFCSFSCATKYINIYYRYDDKKRCQFINHLKYLYSEIYKKDIDILPEAPDKEILDKFGGSHTSEEYKKLIKL
jgi:hypothetical protein